MRGGAARPAFFAGWGNKLPVDVRGGHRVTVAVSPEARPGAGLAYGPRPQNARLARDGYRVITFVTCRRGELSLGSGTRAWPVSFWAGKVLARSPRCVPLDFWVDDEPAPRRATIYLGVPECG